MFHFLYLDLCDINNTVLLPLRSCPMRREGPTLTATGRWMKTSPLDSRSIQVSAASKTASTLMSLFSISPGSPCSDIRFVYRLSSSSCQLSKSQQQHALDLILFHKGTGLFICLFWQKYFFLYAPIQELCY